MPKNEEKKESKAPKEEIKAPEVKPDNAVDEYGVPYKNRYMEYKRKLEKAEREKQEIQKSLDEANLLSPDIRIVLFLEALVKLLQEKLSTFQGANPYDR